MSISEISKKAYQISTGILLFLVPFSIRLSIYALVLWGVNAGFMFAFNRDKVNLRFQHYVYLGSLFAFFVILLISVFISENQAVGFRYASPQIAGFIIPFIAIIGRKSLWEIRYKLASFFILGNLLSAVIMFLNALIKVYILETGTFVNDFFYERYVLFLHPSYAAMSIVFASSLLLMGRFLINRKSFLYKGVTPFIILGFFVMTVYFLSSKAGLLSLFVSFFVFAVSFISQKKINSLFKVAFVFSFLLMIAIIWQNDRFKQEATKITDSFQSESTKVLPDITRIKIWEAAIKAGKQYPIFGCGLGGSVSKISYYYNVSGVIYNAHNQFLDYFVATGIVGLIVFLLIVLIQLRYLLQKNTFFPFLLWVVLYLNMLVESMLFRFAGALMFGLFSALILFVIDSQNSRDTNKSITQK